MANPFVDRAAADRYARARPDLSAAAVAGLRSAIATPVALAVDVGCGTGQSSRAVRAVARRVIGIDASSTMLEAATPADGVEYRTGRAESLPLPDGSCDLVTAGLAFHWFDRDAFLGEARRVLAAGGHLALWTAGCAGRGEPGVEAWTWFGRYQRAYPAPSRDSRPLDDDVARAAGFHVVLRRRFAETVGFTHEAFVEFLTTQSNVLDAVRGDPAALSAARDRLRLETAPFFPGGEAPWRFEGWLAIFRRSTTRDGDRRARTGEAGGIPPSTPGGRG